MHSGKCYMGKAGPTCTAIWLSGVSQLVRVGPERVSVVCSQPMSLNYCETQLQSVGQWEELEKRP